MWLSVCRSITTSTFTCTPPSVLDVNNEPCTRRHWCSSDADHKRYVARWVGSRQGERSCWRRGGVARGHQRTRVMRSKRLVARMARGRCEGGHRDLTPCQAKWGGAGQ